MKDIQHGNAELNSGQPDKCVEHIDPASLKKDDDMCRHSLKEEQRIASRISSLSEIGASASNDRMRTERTRRKLNFDCLQVGQVIKASELGYVGHSLYLSS